MSLYAEPIEWKGSLKMVAKVAELIVDVLQRYNFKGKEGVLCALNGIESIVAEDGREIKSISTGFLDRDITEVLGLMSNGARVILNHPASWYAVWGNYIRPSDVLHRQNVFTATINVRGHVNVNGFSRVLRGYYEKVEISVGIWYEANNKESSLIPRLDEEIEPVIKNIKAIKI